MSSVIPSGGFLVVKLPQYVEESTFGTTPTASPSFNWIGMIDNFDPVADMGVEEIRQVGSEDLQKQLLGKEIYNLKLEWALQNSTFAKYATQSQGGGAGTIDKSLSILTSVKLNNIENYIIAAGCRPKALKLTGKPGQPIKASMDLIARSIAAPNTSHGLTTPTFATDPATAPWNFFDGGANPITFGATALDIAEINVGFDRNPEPIHTVGYSKMQFLPPKTRVIKGDMTIVWSETGTPYTDLLNVTERTLTWVLKSGTSTLTLTNCALNKLDSLSMKPQDVIFERFSISARQGSLT